MRRIAVIGAGITGITTAYALLNRGFEVTVFDRHRYAAMETSFANGGQLSASNAEVWTQWGTIFKREGFDFDCEERGILHVYDNRKEFDHATKVNALLAEGGLHREAVGPDQIREIEPALPGDLYGGYFTRSDFTGDIHAYSRGLTSKTRCSTASWSVPGCAHGDWRRR